MWGGGCLESISLSLAFLHPECPPTGYIWPSFNSRGHPAIPEKVRRDRRQAEAPTPFCWEVVTAPLPLVDLLESAESNSSETLGGNGGGRSVHNGP